MDGSKWVSGCIALPYRPVNSLATIVSKQLDIIIKIDFKKESRDCNKK